MRTIELKVYKFSELSEKAQKRAIEDERNFINETRTIETSYYEERLQQKGFVNPKVLFSYLYSQGDGACFTFDAVNINDLMHTTGTSGLNVLAEYDTLSCRHNSRYCHERSTTFNFESQHDTDHTKEEESFKELYYGLCRDIFRDIVAAMKYHLSDENCIESIERNGYEFLESGEIYV